jgi:SSS family solute:Na+ symporter
VSSVLLSWLGKLYWPELPFMDRMGLVFLAALGLAVLVSLVRPAKAASNLITMEGVSYRTPPSFNVGAAGVILILIALYATYW